MVTTTLALSLVYSAAKKNLQVIELAGTSLMGTGCIIMVACNYFSMIEMDFMLNNQELCLATIYYMLYVGVLTTQFMCHMPVRVFWFAASAGAINYKRIADDRTSIGAVVTFFTVGLILIELIFYVQMKT